MEKNIDNQSLFSFYPCDGRRIFVSSDQNFEAFA